MIDCTIHTVTVPHLPKELAGLRVAQLSDLHRGKITSDDLIWQAVAQVCAWQPDLILLTGDFIDSDTADLAPCMRMLAALTSEMPLETRARAKKSKNAASGRLLAKQARQQITASAPPKTVPPVTMQKLVAPLGVYAVPGNHDAKAGLDQVQAALEANGIVFLKNRNVRLANGLWIVGLDEDYYGTPDVARAFAGVADNAPCLVMAHNPGEADLLADRACVVFSGHTHGGQINVPFFTARQLRRIKAKNYRAGWYDVGKARLYVNRGVGNTELPFRFRCPPEAALFILQPST